MALCGYYRLPGICVESVVESPGKESFAATTANMVAKRDIRVFSPVAMNFKGT